jgi:hypothetical protein
LGLSSGLSTNTASTMLLNGDASRLVHTVGHHFVAGRAEVIQPLGGFALIRSSLNRTSF